MAIKEDLILIAGIGIAIVALAAWAKGAIGSTLSSAGNTLGNAASAVGTAINPVDTGNLAYSAANTITQNMTGDSNATLGGWIYDVTH